MPPPVAIDWTVAASLATAAGTLVLALATFSSVRSANRSARASELSLQEGLRPVLVDSRPEDPTLKIGFRDDQWVRVPGGRAGVEVGEDAIYFVLNLRNIGQGIGVCQAWLCDPRDALVADQHPSLDQFQLQTRDLYIPAGGTGLWQGALRDRTAPVFAAARAVVEARVNFTIYVMYSDMAGGQRAISRFRIQPVGDDGWVLAVVRHWNLDNVDPR